MNAKVNFSHGNREVTMSIGGAEKWEKSTMSRTYFTLAFAGAKLPPVDKLYEVLAGGAKDDTIQVHGRTFGYQLGISCDSKTKRAAAVQAITELLTAFAAPAPVVAAEADDSATENNSDVIADGKEITGATLKNLAALVGAETAQVMDDGSWPYEVPISDIEDKDIFKVDVNYFHEVQFLLQGQEKPKIVFIEGIFGRCDSMLGWVVAQ